MYINMTTHSVGVAILHNLPLSLFVVGAVLTHFPYCILFWCAKKLGAAEVELAASQTIQQKNTTMAKLLTMRQ